MPVEPTPQPTRSVAGGSAGDLITPNPQEFAEALRRIGNENEVVVLLKDPNVAPMAADFLRELPLGGDLVVAVRDVPTGTKLRRKPGLARAGAAAQAALLRVLQNHGVEPYRTDTYALALRIPDDKLIPVLAVLLHHPSVDYVEANQARPVTFTAGPLGSNPSDIKHTFHDVLGAWNYTRGAGVKVGVLDSGYAYEQGSGMYHPDGQLLTFTEGIQKYGFSDDYASYNNCGANGTQSAGSCVPWDDEGHGTQMAGLVGENDNSIGYVGVMPKGITVSMKIAQNCAITRGCGSSYRTYAIEDDDYYWGVRWAGNNGVKVLSMSFNSSQSSSSVYNALYDAYYRYDILLLAGTGNVAEDANRPYPKSWSFVMGVGGVNADGSNYGLDQYQEVSALAGGQTTFAYCASAYAFCSPGSYYGTSGGTSAATAITAGIAGLVRAYNPGLTAPQVRQRLIGNSSGAPHHIVNACKAVSGFCNPGILY